MWICENGTMNFAELLRPFCWSTKVSVDDMEHTSRTRWGFIGVRSAPFTSLHPATTKIKSKKKRNQNEWMIGRGKRNAKNRNVRSPAQDSCAIETTATSLLLLLFFSSFFFSFFSFLLKCFYTWPGCVPIYASNLDIWYFCSVSEFSRCALDCRRLLCSRTFVLDSYKGIQ